jgi:hypothetical protein
MPFARLRLLKMAEVAKRHGALRPPAHGRAPAPVVPSARTAPSSPTAPVPHRLAHHRSAHSSHLPRFGKEG